MVSTESLLRFLAPGTKSVLFGNLNGGVLSRSGGSGGGGLPLRVSQIRLGGNHIYLGRYHDYNQWEYLPHPELQRRGAILPVGATATAAPTPQGRTTGVVGGQQPQRSILRGSGIHGPECSEVLRLILWNRLKQRRLQREVPTEEQMRDFNKLEVACVWFTWSLLLFFWPMTAIGGSYAKHHERFPWTPQRTDGSRGEGPFYWFLE